MQKPSASEQPSPALTRDARPVMLRDAMQNACHPTLSELREKALADATARQREAGEFIDVAAPQVFLYGFARGRVDGLDDAIALVRDPSEAVQSAPVLLAIEVQRAYDQAVERSKKAASVVAAVRAPDQREGDVTHRAHASGEEMGLRRALTIIIGVGNRVDEDGIYEPCQGCGRNRPHPLVALCTSCYDGPYPTPPDRYSTTRPCVSCGKPTHVVPAECFRCSDRRGDAEQDAIALHADGML